jgi:hypothetical protein
MAWANWELRMRKDEEVLERELDYKPEAVVNLSQSYGW